MAVRNVPKKYANLYRKAMARKSRKAAIRLFCLECVGYSEVEVKNCSDNECPFYPYRLFGGGTASKRTSAIRGKNYTRWRNGILKRDEYKCQNCGSVENLQVHHIVPVGKDETKVCENDNATTLCIRCHSEKHRP